MTKTTKNTPETSAQGAKGWPDSIFVLTSELIFYSQKIGSKLADDHLAKFGLGRAHYRVLHMVRYHEGITTNGLLQHLMIKAASLNRVMKDLIKGGYVVQENNTEDRRQRYHYLTKKGLELQSAAFALQREVLEPAFDEAGPEAVEKFLQVLRLMVNDKERSLLSSATHE